MQNSKNNQPRFRGFVDTENKKKEGEKTQTNRTESTKNGSFYQSSAFYVIIVVLLIIIFSSVNKFKETDYNKNLSNKNNEILRKYSYFKKSADGYVAGLLDLYEGGYTHSVNSSTGFSSSGHGTWSQSGESIIFTKTGGTAIEGTARIQHLQTGEIMLVFDNRSNPCAYIQDENLSYVKSMKNTPDVSYEGSASDNKEQNIAIADETNGTYIDVDNSTGWETKIVITNDEFIASTINSMTGELISSASGNVKNRKLIDNYGQEIGYITSNYVAIRYGSSLITCRKR